MYENSCYVLVLVRGWQRVLSEHGIIAIFLTWGTIFSNFLAWEIGIRNNWKQDLMFFQFGKSGKAILRTVSLLSPVCEASAKTWDFSETSCMMLYNIKLFDIWRDHTITFDDKRQSVLRYLSLSQTGDWFRWDQLRLRPAIKKLSSAAAFSSRWLLRHGCLSDRHEMCL